MAANNWITASFFWNGIFIAINTYNIGVLLHEIVPSRLPMKNRSSMKLCSVHFDPESFQRSFASPSGGMRRPESYSCGRAVPWMAWG